MSTYHDSTSVGPGTTARTDDNSQEILDGLSSLEAHLSTLAIDMTGKSFDRVQCVSARSSGGIQGSHALTSMIIGLHEVKNTVCSQF